MLSRKSKSRDLEQTRKEILQATFLEVFQNGFQGTSVDKIVAKTPYTKGALFHQFPSKWDLGYALVDEVLTQMILERWVSPLKDFEDPLNGILAQLRHRIGQASEKELGLGCPLNNLVQEMSTVDKGFQKRLQKALELWIEGIDEHLKRGQKAGYIAKKWKTREIAEYVVMSHEGFYGMIKGMGGDQKLFKSLYSQLEKYFALLR